MMMMMIVDLYSALRRAPLLRYVSRCIVKRNVFSADRKDPMLSDGSRRYQAAGSIPSDLPIVVMNWATLVNTDTERETDNF